MGLRHEKTRPAYDEATREIAAILVQGCLRYRKGFRLFRENRERAEEVRPTAEKGVDSTGPERVRVTKG